MSTQDKKDTKKHVDTLPNPRDFLDTKISEEKFEKFIEEKRDKLEEFRKKLERKYGKSS